MLEENKELENKIRTQILNAYENENKDKEQQIKEANRKIKIQEQSLEKALKDLENYNEAKEKIIDLELENAKSNNLVDSLREQVAILELNNDKSLMSKIESLKNLDQYSTKYKDIKLDLFKDPKFAEYKELENEINILILEINQKLKTLTDERGCHHAGN